ncbi:hypothetical protein GCM10017778_72350 [Streptomyces vinaceus]|nr:hypothetical protein GCM10017778_72350 [Streptomyces vinaceus]
MKEQRFDVWAAGDAYEWYTGRWSRLVAEEFVARRRSRAGVLRRGRRAGAAGTRGGVRRGCQRTGAQLPSRAGSGGGRGIARRAAGRAGRGVRVGSGFADLWEPFTAGQGPAPGYVAGLTEPTRDRLRDRLRDTVPTRPDGSIALTARAWAIQGRKPGRSRT